MFRSYQLSFLLLVINFVSYSYSKNDFHSVESNVWTHESILVNVCIKNMFYDAFLCASEETFPISKDTSVPKSKGRLLAKPSLECPQNYNKWTLIPSKKKANTYLLYNNGTGGYLGAYDRLNTKWERDVFVRDDRIDEWKIYSHAVLNAAVTIRNSITLEYLRAFPQDSFNPNIFLITYHDDPTYWKVLHCD